MKQLPIPARLFVGAVFAAAMGVLWWSGPTFPEQPLLILVLILLSSAASVFKVNIPLTSGGATMSVSYAIDFAAMLLVGTEMAMIVSALSAFSQCTFRTQKRPPIHRTVFSMASLVLTVQATGFVYTWLGGPLVGDAFTLPVIARPLLIAAMIYFLCNTLFIATAIGLSTTQPILRVWKENFQWSAPSYFVGALVAAGLAFIIHSGGSGAYWMAALATAPLYVMYHSYKVYMDRIEDHRRHVRQVSDLHLATIEALALAIDAKDQTAHTHIRRVQVYAAGLARALGMSDTEVQGVTTAALLHDIGKLAVPEHILSKPGPLTPEEFQKVRVHPQVGAEIIAGVPFPYPVAPLILSHHERWDGKGYPSGLKGEEIPLGARILSAVDYFDALMSERPYHKAMSFDAAIGLLQKESGKALDPRVVTTFVEMYPALAAEAEATQQPARKLTRIPSHAPAAQPAVGFVGEGRTSVFEDIAIAHREIYALYEIAQAMGSSLGVPDTMALISSKLSTLVPFSCCALFLYSKETESLRCRYAAGVDAELLHQLAIKSGAGLTGWVARTRQPLVNARPISDFQAGGLDVPTTLQSALVCPLIVSDRLIGTMAVYHTGDAVYTDDHRRLLDRICEQAAAVILNSMVFEQTQEDSLTDPLTALPNTRFMFMHLQRELSRASRLKAEVALLVMDMDGFKTINDTYGHNVGDRALREVASVLRAGIRPYDLCVRYAGDEFIVVLSGCTVGEAERKALELQQAVDQLRFDAAAERVISIGISVGVAVFPHDGDSYETLLATADSHMYRDKTRRKKAAETSASQTPGDTASDTRDESAVGIV